MVGGDFRSLNIWKKARELVLVIYKLTSNFPKDERFGLIDQIRRASCSIAANIAEAHGRFYYADKIRVLFQARGECYEVMSHLSLALGLGFLKQIDFDNLDKEFEGLGVGINAYISSLKKTT